MPLCSLECSDKIYMHVSIVFMQGSHFMVQYKCGIIMEVQYFPFITTVIIYNLHFKYTLYLWTHHTCTIYLLTPWSKVLLEKLTASQLVKKNPAFYGNRRFIITFTSANHLSLSWDRLIPSMPPNSTSWRSTLILSTCLCLGLPSSLLLLSFPT